MSFFIGGAVGRDDVGIVPYGWVARGAGADPSGASRHLPLRRGGFGVTDCHGRFAPSQ